MILTTNSAIVPYPYQQECLRILKMVEKKQDTALVVKAGGLGKTITSALYVKHRFETYGEKRCLYLSHLTENLDQAEIDYRKVLPKATYGYFTGEKKTPYQVNILYASFQTMRECLDMFHPEEFDIIIIDESHHSKAPTHEKVVMYFTPRFKLALTATPDRMDELDIRELYGQEVYYLSFVNALCRRLLCPIDYRVMTDEIGSFKKLDTEKGRLSISHLNRTVFVPKRDEEIAKIIQSNIDEIENPCVMIYVSSPEHAELLAEMLPGSIPVHYKVPKAERKTRLELFRQGVFKIMISVDMFNESLDVPQINMEVFLRATGSPTIFYQQLMRGCRLHPGKTVVRVLDFVANCERIFQVYDLYSKVKVEQEPSIPNFGVSNTASTKVSIDPFALNVDSIDFREKIVPLIETITLIRSGFYKTWQEAGEVVQKLGIKNRLEYAERYKEDDRLPSGPSWYYEDFPGWATFTNNKDNIRLIENCYPTWQEASDAALKIGITSSKIYAVKYKDDLLLPSRPHKQYQDFPGWGAFLGTGRVMRTEESVYATIEEATIAAKKLGALKEKDYKKKYKSDPRLPSSPERFYGESFPGWGAFLGTGNESFKRKDKGELYPTWEEAKTAVEKLGITGGSEYEKKYSLDPLLPKNLWMVYKDFPGWNAVQGKVQKEYYSDWKTASTAAIKLGISSRKSYQQNYSGDSKLPYDPSRYYDGFPGWRTFLNNKPLKRGNAFYSTWQEASMAALNLGINIKKEYEKLYKKDEKLHSEPGRFYKDFPDWKTFLTVK